MWRKILKYLVPREGRVFELPKELFWQLCQEVRNVEARRDDLSSCMTQRMQLVLAHVLLAFPKLCRSD